MSELERQEYSRTLQEQFDAMADFIERKTPCASIGEAADYVRQHPEVRNKPDYWYRRLRGERWKGE